MTCDCHATEALAADGEIFYFIVYFKHLYILKYAQFICCVCPKFLPNFQDCAGFNSFRFYFLNSVYSFEEKRFLTELS